MNEHFRMFSEQYAHALQAYLTQQEPAHLARALDLGRKAFADGLGVVNVAQVHDSACRSSGLNESSTRRPSVPPAQHFRFLLEALSAYASANRNSEEASQKLQKLNETLSQRNA